jgi:hypothetical protein
LQHVSLKAVYIFFDIWDITAINNKRDVPCHVLFLEFVFKNVQCHFFTVHSISASGLVTILLSHIFIVRYRNSATDVSSGYGLNDRGFGVLVLVIPNFSILHVVHTVLGLFPSG